MIAYSSQPDNPCCGSWDVWVRSASGADPINVTRDEAAAEWWPQFSPDGKRLLYRWFSGLTADLYAVPVPTTPGIAALAAPVTPGAVAVTTLGTVQTSADWIDATTEPACTITGTDGRDLLRGTSGDDVICALGGNDIVRGLGGDDTILAGAGLDLVDAGAGNDTVQGGDGTDTLVGGIGNDTVAGDAGIDIVTGGPGADTMLGGDGRDVLFGIDLTRGNDQLDGGAERDACFADPGDLLNNC